MGLAEQLNRIETKQDALIDRVTIIETTMTVRSNLYKTIFKISCSICVIIGIFFTFDKYKIRIEKPEHKTPVKIEQKKDI